jgi:hypothetical protein
MRLALVAAGIALLLVSSCGDAPGNVQGGDPLFAPPYDCTNASTCGTWAHMYACYFGPSAPSNGCSGPGVCHATAAGSGVPFSGFVCGGTSASCWQGMMNASPPLVSAASKSAKGLHAALYQPSVGPPGTKGNNMPTTGLNAPPYTSSTWMGFTKADIACIDVWAAAGVPNN